LGYWDDPDVPVGITKNIPVIADAKKRNIHSLIQTEIEIVVMAVYKHPVAYLVEVGRRKLIFALSFWNIFDEWHILIQRDQIPEALFFYPEC
jgi:hypothetical protein